MPVNVASIVYDRWLNQKTLFCHRYQAKISPAACERLLNSSRESESGGCNCCAGLENQEPHPHTQTMNPVGPLLSRARYDFVGWFSTIQGDGFSPDEADDLLYRKPQKGKYRVPVFMGRCRRCGGWMQNTIERHGGERDDNVYRCIACGWRTSPEYEANRKNLIKI